jgi:hypothetical protein
MALAPEHLDIFRSFRGNPKCKPQWIIILYLPEFSPEPVRLTPRITETSGSTSDLII